jgi:putative hydrolase of the HAD superfamily
MIGTAPSPRRAVLLDGLGTLVALAPPGPALARGLAEEHGIELSRAQAERAFRAEMAYYRAHHHEGRDTASLTELRRRCATVLHDTLPPSAAGAIDVEALTPIMLAALRFGAYPDATATLPQLRERGLALVVVSNWDVSLDGVLCATGLAQLLDGVVTSAAVGRPKPAPEIFWAALELAGVGAERALHVGDSPEHDVAGALAAGVEPVLLRRERRAACAPPANAPVIRSLAELPALI